MSPLIALYGPQQVGKSTAAESLSKNHGYVRVSFADPLYRMLAGLLDIPFSSIKKLPKEVPMPELQGKTIRYALQTLGTEWGRNMIGGRLWVSTASRTIMNHLKDGQLVVVDDCRFLNEYYMLRDLGASFVELRRDYNLGQSNPKHGSEVEWKQFTADAQVTNLYVTGDGWLDGGADVILSALSKSLLRE